MTPVFFVALFSVCWHDHVTGPRCGIYPIEARDATHCQSMIDRAPRRAFFFARKPSLQARAEDLVTFEAGE